MDQPREIAMDVRDISDKGVIMPEEVALILEQLKDIKEVVRSTATTAQNTAVQVAQLTERMNAFSRSLNGVQEIAERLDRAVNGNGAPGLKEMTKDHERRLKQIEGETEEEDDWAGGVEASLEDHNERLTTIETLHRAEREAVEKAEEKKKAETESMRKVRWSMIFFGITALIDLLLKLAGLPR
jgi:chromosome segregation ATPase